MDEFTEEDDRLIHDSILERLTEERLNYTYKIISECGQIVLQAIENEKYRVHINYYSMYSGEEKKWD